MHERAYDKNEKKPQAEQLRPNFHSKTEGETISKARMTTRYQRHKVFYISVKGGDPSPRSRRDTLLRLHPSRCPIRGRLPPLLVSSPTSGPNNSHGVTGGVYKARERIHRGMLIRDY